MVRPPYFGGKLESWDHEAVRQQPGIVDTFEIHSGIAIVAHGYWPARKAAGGMEVRWKNDLMRGVSTNSIREGQRKALAEEKPHYGIKEGNIDKGMESASTVIKAEYVQPTLNHGPMEPMNATAIYNQRPQGESCEVWSGVQAPQIAQNVVAEYVDLPRSKVVINTELPGGGFGRRTYPDYVAEAAVIAKKLPNTPIKLIWSREGEVQHDYYRPAYLHQLEAGLDEEGNVVAHSHNIAIQSLVKGFATEVVASNLPTWVPRSYE